MTIGGVEKYTPPPSKLLNSRAIATFCSDCDDHERTAFCIRNVDVANRFGGGGGRGVPEALKTDARSSTRKRHA